MQIKNSILGTRRILGFSWQEDMKTTTTVNSYHFTPTPPSGKPDTGLLNLVEMFKTTIPTKQFPCFTGYGSLSKTIKFPNWLQCFI